jgi:hypothetical protein
MAKDIFHEAVRNALIKDGWTITHDPYEIRMLGVESDIDLGAEKMIAAEREGEGRMEKIAIEVKSFISASFMRDFHNAVGQFTNYRILLTQKEPDRRLYLAVPRSVYIRKFGIEGVKLICREAALRLVVYDQVDEKLVVWER